MQVTVNGKSFAPIAIASETLQKNRVEHSPYGFPFPFISPGGYGDCWWEIDSSIAAEGRSYFDFDDARNMTENFFAVQKENGRVPLYGPDILPTGPLHSKQTENASALPVLLGVWYRMAMRDDDEAYCARAYQAMVRYLRWWQAERTDAETQLMTSLFEETFPPYLNVAGEYCGVDTNALVAYGAKQAAELARRLGKTAEAEEWTAFGRKIFAAMNAHLWDEENGLFRPLDLRTKTLGCLSAEGFYMFLDSDLPADRREKLLRTLKSDDFNWSGFAVTSMSKCDASFTMTKTEKYQCNPSWCGMVWTLINRIITDGLLESGYREEAVLLARKTVQLLQTEAREFYAPDDGKGYGAKQYSWTAAHAVTLFLEVVCGISYDLKTQSVQVNPQTPDTVEIADLCVARGLKADLLLQGGRCVRCAVKHC